MSGKNSRANSASGRSDRIPPEIPPPPENPFDQDMDSDSGMGVFDTEEYELTRDHPLGAILLQIAHDNTVLANKCKVREMELNIGDLCQKFQQVVQLEEEQAEARYQKAAALETQKQLQRELNSHMLNQEIEPPDYFSPIPTLTSPHKVADCQKLFPSRHNKFSGSAKDNHMNIVEFLSLMKAGQRQCQLSEDEFKDALLTSTTGKAHTLIAEWIDNHLSMSSIFHNLSLHFDKRLTADEARLQLSAYKAPKTANLAEVVGHIQLLAGRISAVMPDQISCQATYNMEIINTLIKCLPQYSSTIVQNTYNQLSARLGRACEATELSKALNMYRQSVDSDIKLHGVDSGKNRLSRPGPNSNRRDRNPTWPQYSSYSVNRVDTQSYLANRDKRSLNRPAVNRPYQKFKNPAPPPRNAAVRYVSQANNSGGRRFSNSKPGNRKLPFRPRQNISTTGCTLCGLNDHTASQGCLNMRLDNGRLYKTLPVYSTCNLCPGNKKNTLNHPPMLCPFRKGGPLEKSG